MAKQPYTVRVNAPSQSAVNWDYPVGYFPRKFHYLKDAKECANRAVARGATMARVEYPNGAELDIRPK